MEEKTVVSDAIRLAKNILHSLLPDEKWAMVNIAKDDRDSFVLEKYPYIPTTFGYFYDKTPLLLQKNGVIEGTSEGLWFIRVSNEQNYSEKNVPVGILIGTKAEQVAQSKGYIGAEQAFYYYINDDENSSKQKDVYRSKRYQHDSVLINRELLEKFIGKFENNKFTKSPSDRDYWYEHKQLNFRLADGSIKALDFSNANVLRKIFETFWELWTGDGGGRYTREQVIEKYNQLFKDKELNTGLIGDRVANIRRTIINPKPELISRIDWKFDFKEAIWIFKIYNLKIKT